MNGCCEGIKKTRWSSKRPKGGRVQTSFTVPSGGGTPLWGTIPTVGDGGGGVEIDIKMDAPLVVGVLDFYSDPGRHCSAFFLQFPYQRGTSLWTCFLGGPGVDLYLEQTRGLEGDGEGWGWGGVGNGEEGSHGRRPEGCCARPRGRRRPPRCCCTSRRGRRSAAHRSTPPAAAAPGRGLGGGRGGQLAGPMCDIPEAPRSRKITLLDTKGIQPNPRGPPRGFGGSTEYALGRGVGGQGAPDHSHPPGGRALVTREEEGGQERHPLRGLPAVELIGRRVGGGGMVLKPKRSTRGGKTGHFSQCNAIIPCGINSGCT